MRPKGSDPNFSRPVRRRVTLVGSCLRSPSSIGDEVSTITKGLDVEVTTFMSEGKWMVFRWLRCLSYESVGRSKGET